jgi:hypothetical protein
LERHPQLRERIRSRDAVDLQAYNPLFKERVPELHVAYRASGLSLGARRVSHFMALHSLGIARACGEAAFCSDPAREPAFL